MVDVHAEAVCAAPREQAFGYIADYRNVGTWLYGVKKFVPVGDLDYGLDSVFDAALTVGAPIKTRVQVVEFAEGERFAFHSIKGFVCSSTWTFTAVDASHTQVAAEISYTLPGGIAGKALGKAIEPFVGIAVKHSVAALQREIEAGVDR